MTPPESLSPRFSALESFITKDMRMSQVYQPVMLLELLRSLGKASVNFKSKLRSYSRFHLFGPSVLPPTMPSADF